MLDGRRPEASPGEQESDREGALIGAQGQEDCKLFSNWARRTPFLRSLSAAQRTLPACSGRSRLLGLTTARLERRLACQLLSCQPLRQGPPKRSLAMCPSSRLYFVPSEEAPQRHTVVEESEGNGNSTLAELIAQSRQHCAAYHPDPHALSRVNCLDLRGAPCDFARNYPRAIPPISPAISKP